MKTSPLLPRVLPLALLLVLGPASTAGESATNDWPQFLGPNRDGSAPSAFLAHRWPDSGPPRVWQRPVGQGFAGPVVAGDRLILFHRLGNNEVLDCLDAANGQPLWSSATPTAYTDDFGFDEGPRATPAIAAGRVFTLGAAGAIRCHDLATGKVVWTRDAKTEFRAPKGFFGMACSPLVEGDLVLLNLGGADDAGIVALDTATGKLRWKATDHEASYSSPVAADLHGGRRALFFTRNGLVGLDPASGRIVFEHPWRARLHASVNAATPIVRSNAVFLSASYQTGALLLRLDGDRPTEVWSGDDILSNHYATSVESGGFLYGFDGRQEHGCRLRCIEWSTGRVRWTQESLAAGTLIVAGKDLLILTEKGELIRAPATPDAFRPAARAQILPFGVRAHAALANGRLYARSKDQLVCLNLGPAAASEPKP